MDQEEFDKLKEEEKEHLRQIRELKRRLRSAQGTLRAKQALQDMEEATNMAELNAALETVTGETIDAEARLDVAMEMAGDAGSDPLLSPEELRQRKADELVAQMKATLLPEQSRRSEKARAPEDVSTSETEALPDKTIGRMKTEAEEESDTLPEKTIGRMGAVAGGDAE